MGVDPLLQLVLGDEALTRGLGDAEARVLVEWLVDRAEHLGATSAAGKAADEVRRLMRRGRAIARFIVLWSSPRTRGAANQLAGAERFTWPLPDGTADACDLMQTIVLHEDREIERLALQERAPPRAA